MKTTSALGLLVGAVLALPTLARAADCIPVEVTIDAAHRAIDLTIRPPTSVSRVGLKDLAPYSRKTLWQSPDGSASVENDAVVAAAGQHILHLRMDVTRAPEREDRAYSPFLRFGDGTIAFDSRQLLPPENDRDGLKLCARYQAAKGQQVIGFGQVSDTSITLPAGAEGYVAFGTPQVMHHHGVWLVSDRTTPAAVRERVATEVPRLVDFYTHWLGPAKLPTLFLYSVGGDQGTRNFHGDHLPGSITLGLSGQNWDVLDDEGVRSLTGFLAHELFHTWNAAPRLGSPEGEGLLAKEGGAELARIMATASLAHQSAQQWLPEVASLYNACLFEQPAQQSIAKALAARGPGSLPYNCGAPLMLVLAVAADPHDPVAGFFGLWKALAEQHRRTPASGYAWTDLLPAGDTGALRQRLLDAIQQPGGYADNMPAALAEAGVRVQPAQQLSKQDSQRYASALMAHLMKLDCGGNVSFWTQPDGFLLDKSLATCHVLKAGRKVTALLDQSVDRADLLALAAQMAERCARGQPVKVSYQDESESSEVPCTQPLPAQPRPVLFTGLGNASAVSRAAAASSPTIAR